jgi:hypothetical protein
VVLCTPHQFNKERGRDAMAKKAKKVAKKAKKKGGKKKK